MFIARLEKFKPVPSTLKLQIKLVSALERNNISDRKTQGFLYLGALSGEKLQPPSLAFAVIDAVPEMNLLFICSGVKVVLQNVWVMHLTSGVLYVPKKANGLNQSSVVEELQSSVAVFVNSGYST